MLTDYSNFNFYFFNQEATGSYGLKWTFKTAGGLRRFASFFANPLEFAASTLLALSVLAWLYTDDDNKITLNKLGILAVLTTQFAIFIALSHSSLASYFIMIFIYSLITRMKVILNIMVIEFIAIVVYFAFFMLLNNPELYEFINETITFTNPSSVGHVLV